MVTTGHRPLTQEQLNAAVEQILEDIRDVQAHLEEKMDEKFNEVLAELRYMNQRLDNMGR